MTKSLKKLLAVTLSLVMVLGTVAVGGSGITGMLSVKASATENSGTCGDNAAWSIEDGVLTISGSGDMTDYSYTSGSRAPWYSMSSSITSVVVEGNIGEIGDYAFSELRNVTSVTISSGVTGIGRYAFGFCSMKSLTIPDSVTSIGTAAFQCCYSLETAVLGNGITEIPNGLFFSCKKLKSVVLPQSITAIGNTAFDNCPLLESIEIPDSVASIGYWAFSDCPALKSVNIPKSLTVISAGVFSGCSSIESFEIPDSVTTIENYAFRECSSLQSINIPKSVTSIGTEVFSSCSSLSAMTVDEENTVYDSRNDCNAIIETATDKLIYGCAGTVIPDTVTAIANNAFYESGAGSVEIPDSVTSIGSDSFYGVYNVNYSENMTATGSPWGADNANLYNDGIFIFADSSETVLMKCSNQASGAVVIPDTVKAISEEAFMGCTKITAVTIPEGVETIGECAFGQCEKLESIVIPDSVTSLGAEAFEECRALQSVTLGSGIKSLSDYLFFDCEKLSSIVIPEGVTTICEGAFGYCIGLESLDIPASVTEIGNYITDEYNPLPSITVDEKNTVYDSRNNCNAIIETATDTLILGCKNTVIPDDVNAIGDFAFLGCEDLTAINIPEGVTSLGEYSFCGCENLTEIYIPDSVTEIGDSAFWYCTSIKSINIPDGIETIEPYAFGGCLSLTEVQIPDSVTAIGSDAFEDDTSLTAIDIPADVTSVGEYAFKNCSSLKYVIIPELVTINNSAFDDCNQITDVYFRGSESEKTSSIEGTSDNAYKNAVWHYDYTESYVWSEDCGTCTASASWTDNGEIVTASAEKTSSCRVITPATRNKDGKGFFTASFDSTPFTVQNTVGAVKYRAFISASCDRTEMLRGQKATFTITTTTDVAWIKLNGSYTTAAGDVKTLGSYYKYNSASNAAAGITVTDEDGVRTWVIPVSLSYTVSDDSVTETWKVDYKLANSSKWCTAMTESGDWTSQLVIYRKAASVTPSETYGKYTLVSADTDKTEANVGDTVTFTVRTTGDVSKVRIGYNYTANGASKTKSVTYQTTSSNVKSITDNGDGTSTWTISYKVPATAVGETSFNVQVRGESWGTAQSKTITVA